MKKFVYYMALLGVITNGMAMFISIVNDSYGWLIVNTFCFISCANTMFRAKE